MATQAQSYETLNAAAEWGAAAALKDRKRAAGAARLRPLPAENLYFYRKAIDNSGVVCQADPRAGRQCWRWIASATAATLILVALLWPNVYGMVSGYQIESLKVQQQRLLAERSSLDLEEARLLDPARLDQLAQEQLFVTPAPNQVEFLPPKADGSLALNVSSK